MFFSHTTTSIENFPNSGTAINDQQPQIAGAIREAGKSESKKVHLHPSTGIVSAKMRDK